MNRLAITRVGAISRITFIELTRLKSFYFLLLFALLLIGDSVFMTQFSFQQEFQILKDVGLGSMSIFTSLLAILATAQLIPKDLEDRTIGTILAKPVSRFEYLLGKLGGVLMLIALSLIIMSALFLIVLKIRETTVVSETLRQMSPSSPEQITETLAAVRASAFNWGLIAGIAIIFAKACLLAALTLFISTFASTAIFTTSMMVFIYFIGHLQGTARAYWLQTNSANWLTTAFFLVITLFFPDLQLFNLVDDIVAGSTIPISLLTKTIFLALIYVGFYLAPGLGRFLSERIMKRALLILTVAGVFGGLKVHPEQAINETHRRLRLRAVDFNLNLRNQIGQFGFVAGLSGFRSLIADLLYIKTYMAWEQTDWVRVLLYSRQVTTLQPRSILFWDTAAWHMAWNASAAALRDPKQPKIALRLKAQREYLELGKNFLERGIEKNPDHPQLYEAMARLYRDKYNDHEHAAEFFEKAAAFSEAPGYVKRFAAYELAQCRGREEEAYDSLIALYSAGEQERLPTLIQRLTEIENKLDIPIEKRIPKTSVRAPNR